MSIDEYTQEQVAEAMEGLPALWVLKHQIKNESGLLIDFKKRKYLWDIYNDLSPKQVLCKPPQMGATIMNTLKVFWVAKKLKKDIIYTLPTATDVVDIVGGSVNRIIAQNEILRGWVKDHDTVEQKSVGNNLIRFRGTFSAKQATMVPSSLNVHDEVDNSDPIVLTLYQTRQEAQEREEDKWQWYFSHPSLAGIGVDVQWQKSDQKEWYITCNECKKEQTLQWPQNISMERQCFICESCECELLDEVRINGRWIDKDGRAWNGVLSPLYEFSGWHVSQLMLFNKSAKSIIEAYNDPQKDRQYFWNYVLGLPYISSDDRIEPAVVLRNVVDRVNPRTARTIIGCDTGHGLHYVLMNKDGVFFYDYAKEITATKDPYDVIRGHLKRFERSIAVFDQGGDLIGVRKLVQEFPGRIFLCFYNKDRKTVDFIEWGENDEYWKVRVDRNRMMTLMVEQLRDIGRIPLNGTKEEWQEFADMFGNLYREKIVVKESKGKDDRSLYGTEYVWKRKGPDHFCFVPGTLITTENGDVPIESVRVGSNVLTRSGFQRVEDNFIGKTNADVVTAYFTDGSSFTATPDHPVVTTEGKVRLDGLDCHAILYSCETLKKSFTTKSNIGDTPYQNEEATDSTTVQMELLKQKDTKDFTSKYGLMRTVKFLKDLSSITMMVMRIIMKFQTLLSNRVQNIRVTMYEKDSKIPNIKQEMMSIFLRFAQIPTNGEKLKGAKNGCVLILWGALFFVNHGILYVLSAILKLLHGTRVAVNSAVPDVQIVGLHANIEKRDVINLTVENEHEYYANGILVGNCHALLYAIIGMQRYGGEPAKILGNGMFDGIPRGTVATLSPELAIVGSISPQDVRGENRIF